MSDVTSIVTAIEHGDAQAADQLLPLVYEELRRLAAHKLSQELPGQTLQPTSLVHEAYLRLTGKQDQKWDGRGHFFAAAAEAMRRILIESARRKRALRHGGGQERLNIQDVDVADFAKADELIAVNETLEKFGAENKRKAELVKLRYFAGLTIEEAAEVMDISVPTAKRWWAYARAWLHNELVAGQGR
jgi:RNA polymerase sigma factor (TIGR02999 family)